MAVQHLCQQLLDAILANICSPVFSHSLRICFSHDCHPRPTHHVHPAGLGFVEGSWPALGHMYPVWSPCCLLKAPVVCTQKHRLEDDQRQSTPSVLQGEVARLDPKCMINLDPSHCSYNGTVHSICKLGECPGASGWRWLANLDRSPRPLPFEPEGTVPGPRPVFTLCRLSALSSHTPSSGQTSHVSAPAARAHAPSSPQHRCGSACLWPWGGGGQDLWVPIHAGHSGLQVWKSESQRDLQALPQASPEPPRV
uniref:Uncharacterized protein n=1 Tax=Macaca mulatta TaxID=9544 RepID=A0A5F8AJW4_MACMU|nr:uncharacterized protein LOC100426235 isoform X1 [Macaca mulatta]XP_028686420.1 uncharacterized protein LOC100426235 isoform X1 [Macaca mulatta]